MAGQPLVDLEREVGETVTVLESATTLINGFQARLDAAVQAALANGATADELAPLTDLSAELDAKTNELAAAVQANTPAPEPEQPSS